MLVVHVNTVRCHPGCTGNTSTVQTHTHRQKHTLADVHIDMTRIPCIVKNAAQPAGAVSLAQIQAGAKISGLFLLI